MLKLQPNPTFSCPIDIPIPGGAPHKLGCTFRHRTVDQLTELHTKYPGAPGFAYVKEILEGWDLGDAFTDDHLRELLQKFPGAATALMKGYIAELHGVRMGN